MNDVGFGTDGPYIKLIFKMKYETHAYGIKNVFKKLNKKKKKKKKKK